MTGTSTGSGRRAETISPAIRNPELSNFGSVVVRFLKREVIEVETATWFRSQNQLRMSWLP